ncbi:MAG: LemA family protein [Propionibacteriaceae bacterium]|nr:LemA family protein [Propionibacteriaceae bacterium]
MEALIAIAAIVIVILVVWVVVARNNLVTTENLVTQSWRLIDVELQRRHDLIPNLVRVVEAYTQYERAAIEALTTARSAAMAAQPIGQRGVAEQGLGVAVDTVLARSEAYPQLRADEQFIDLQRELVETENRLAASRRIYNSNVRELDIALESFPSSIIGSLMHMSPAEYFSVTETVQPNGSALPGM